ncbi:hypothetical protein [Flammeovirga aprica]|uniref:Uncharacterized protein n=1 Tax=Flammeovirga aprica JL-4 TaxID=694437 RepID=A0A7X9S0K5_9BACT|nr:hypothetical protein [Flammeovirga aprica]NME72158.1 hypothetical protein [Flammeovirga aprica JL-4]
MASGFIILKDGRCFARRCYDEILQIVIIELEDINNGKELANWLKLQIPDSNDDEDSDAGWGFYNSRIDEWITRELDLRSLTLQNQNLFWKAIQSGRNNLVIKGIEYSTLSIDSFNSFYKMYSLAEKGEPPMELSDWNNIAEPCIDKNGPGWE